MNIHKKNKNLRAQAVALPVSICRAHRGPCLPAKTHQGLHCTMGVMPPLSAKTYKPGRSWFRRGARGRTACGYTLTAMDSTVVSMSSVVIVWYIVAVVAKVVIGAR